MTESGSFQSFAQTVFAMPRAVGTGILIHTAEPVGEVKRHDLLAFVSQYEQVLSRFRSDSLVARIAREGAGDYEFPAWAADLFHICDVMGEATGGRFDSCVGADLVRLGYGPAWSFPVAASASPGGVQKDTKTTSDGARSTPHVVTSRTGVQGLAGGVHNDTHDVRDGETEGMGLVNTRTGSAIPCSGAVRGKSAGNVRRTSTDSISCGGVHNDAKHDDYEGPVVWGEVVTHTGSVLHVKAPVLLDFGAVGKGLLVDLLAEKLIGNEGSGGLVIDAGGDLFSTVPLTVALESPWNTAQAVGEAHMPSGAFCASSPSRRHWTDVLARNEVHHLIDALTGRPIMDTVASWTWVPCDAGAGAGASPTSYPTAWADAQCTAVFCGLNHGFPFARIASDGSAALSPTFPGRFFTDQD